MKTIKKLKIVSIIFIVIVCFSCEISKDNVSDFTKSVTEDLIKQDSISLYNKQMNGEISGRYGFLKYLKSEDNPKSPDEFIKISKENYEKAKSAEISRLSGIIYQFKNSLDSKIRSIETDTIYIREEKDVQDMQSTILKSKKNYKLWRVILKIETESGSKFYFRPGFVISLNGKLYYDMKDFELSKEKFNLEKI